MVEEPRLAARPARLEVQHEPASADPAPGGSRTILDLPAVAEALGEPAAVEPDTDTADPPSPPVSPSTDTAPTLDVAAGEHRPATDVAVGEPEPGSDRHADIERCPVGGAGGIGEHGGLRGRPGVRLRRQLVARHEQVGLRANGLVSLRAGLPGRPDSGSPARCLRP